MREASLGRVCDAWAAFTSNYQECSDDADVRARLRRVDGAGMRVILAALDVMHEPTAEGTTMLVAMANLVRGVRDVRRKDGAWSVDLANAVDRVAEYAPGEARIVAGVQRAVTAADWHDLIRWSRRMPAERDAVFLLLFKDLDDESAGLALTNGYAWLSKEKKRTPAGLVARLLLDAIRRGVQFPGSTWDRRTKIGAVQRAIGLVLARRG